VLADVHALCAVGMGGQAAAAGNAADSPRHDGLDQLLEKADVLPPLLVTAFDAGYAQYLDTDFILGQGAQRFRDRFARGLSAYLDLPFDERLLASRALWDDLLTALLSHGLIDVAVNQLRAGLASDGAPTERTPVLWTNLYEQRLFAFDLSLEEIQTRRKEAPTPDPNMRLTIEDLGDRVSIGGVVLPKRSPTPATSAANAAQKAAPDIDIEQGEGYVRVGDHEVPIQEHATPATAEQPEPAPTAQAETPPSTTAQTATAPPSQSGPTVV
ncbi:MAG: hypothetical protein KDD83_26495, partial [Caldilineaceae bacterium]|nr:hypothetical protein [Caldilineaceae bacterium]